MYVTQVVNICVLCRSPCLHLHSNASANVSNRVYMIVVLCGVDHFGMCQHANMETCTFTCAYSCARVCAQVHEYTHANQAGAAARKSLTENGWGREVWP